MYIMCVRVCVFVPVYTSRTGIHRGKTGAGVIIVDVEPRPRRVRVDVRTDTRACRYDGARTTPEKLA